MKNTLSPGKLARLALFVALTILLQNYLGIHTDYLKIGFSFVPIALCAMLYGPLWAGAVAGMADVFGWFLYPVAGYFPGFTAVACLNGVVFGLLLYRRSDRWAPVAAAVAVNQLLGSLLINTWFMTILYSTPFLVLLPARALQCCIMIPVQIAVLRLLSTRKFLSLLDKHALA